MKHKHCEVIKAWADGATIQIWSPISRMWMNVAGDPAWGEGNKYRVKTETVRYRVSLHKHAEGHHYTHTVCDSLQEVSVSNFYNFIRWLTDWQEVEV